MSPEPQSKEHIMYCDECNDLIMPKEKFYSLGGKILCIGCYHKP